MICLICSIGRSGSTLLDVLIGSHPQGASLGEFSFLGKAISLDQPCSCGEPISACRNWQAVLADVASDRGTDLRTTPYALQQWDAVASVVIDHDHQTRWYRLRTKLHSAACDLRFSAPPHSMLRLPLAPTLAQGVDNTLYLYETVMRQWDKRFLVDSSKNVHKALAVHEANPSDVRIIFLTRDGRGVFHSRHSSGFSARESARAWFRYNRRAQSLLTRNLPDEHLFRMRYEDLMADPPGVMRSLCAFLKIDFVESMLEVTPGKQHPVNGNDMRLKPRQELRLDERWKTDLSAEDRTYFDRHTGSLNAVLGYSD